MALYLPNQAKLFLDIMAVKKLKTIYNNKKIASDIRQYILKYIQNLNKILANLEQASIIITKAKSQFC